MRVFVLNTGGTMGMIGKPLRPAKSAGDLMRGIRAPRGIELALSNYRRLYDSTNVKIFDRVEMASMIETVYDEHDAFIVLHGTDTLAETAATLCMVFKTLLQKPLFVIGAQMTKDESGSEVRMQIENTLRVAEAFCRHEIVGVYNVCMGEVWDGSRLVKRCESDYMAFYTPGRFPVARVGPTVSLRQGLRQRDPVLAVQGLGRGLLPNLLFERRVCTIAVSADTPPWVLLAEARAKKHRLRGFILECKGAGNIPDRKWDKDYPHSWIEAIRIATNAGIHVGILSPFDDGRVILDRYELGQKAKRAGALSLESLTSPMADVKFRHAIAVCRDDPAKIQEFISTNIVGELLHALEAEVS